jgi:hypothetical protein
MDKNVPMMSIEWRISLLTNLVICYFNCHEIFMILQVVDVSFLKGFHLQIRFMGFELSW